MAYFPTVEEVAKFATGEVPNLVFEGVEGRICLEWAGEDNQLAVKLVDTNPPKTQERMLREREKMYQEALAL